MQTHFSIDRDRLSVLTGALVLALALSRFLETPVRRLATDVFGSRLTLNLSATTIMLLIVFGMAITAAESLVRSHPQARKGDLQNSYIFWIVPGLLTLALASWLNDINDLGLWTVALIASSILMPISLAAEYTAVDPNEERRTMVDWGVMVLIHLVAVIIFIRIYDLRARSLISATAVMLVASLLAARLYWSSLRQLDLSFLYGLSTGLCLGLLTWVINYWPLSSLQGGLLLLVFFYALAGLINQYLNDRFRRQIVFEYVGIAAFIAVFAIFLAG